MPTEVPELNHSTIQVTSISEVKIGIYSMRGHKGRLCTPLTPPIHYLYGNWPMAACYFQLCYMIVYCTHSVSLVPRPPHSFCRLQYEKRGRPGISYHVNDVEGRERVERL